MKYTTIKEASENAFAEGVISVDGVNVYWDGFGVMDANDATGTGLCPDTVVYGGDNDEYRTL